MIRVLAPAKVNLGLEILGKRDDGYHEIRTILCAVSVFDSLDIDPHGLSGLSVDDLDLEVENLIDSALDLVADNQPDFVAPEVRLRKRIPTAAGLGGASSDAAATLLGVRRLYPHTVDDCTLQALASKLGSDVPFFLRPGLALGSGRGEMLRQLPYQRVDIVIVHPPLSIARKTVTMYGLLDRSDWTDGSVVKALADSLEKLQPLPTDALLPNAFRRPVSVLHPPLEELSAQVSRLAGLPAQLSGAGPAHFVICRDVEHRQWVRNRLREAHRRDGVRVLAGRSVRPVLVRAS
jgi:4-diphosphocytidyl-2-C-methyl-D-erythritol kinase